MNKPDLEKCTVQDACDYAVFKIVEQGKQCMGYSACAYADEEGNHCAIGWLLDHEDEGLMSHDGSVVSLLSVFPKQSISELIRKNLEVFGVLQFFHDCNDKEMRIHILRDLENFIDTSAPQYQKWVEMGQGE